MGFNDFLKKIIGNKAQRDLKEISPFVDKVKAVYDGIKSLLNDELRARTEALKSRIQDYVATEQNRIAELKASIEGTEIIFVKKYTTKLTNLKKKLPTNTKKF